MVRLLIYCGFVYLLYNFDVEIYWNLNIFIRLIIVFALWQFNNYLYICYKEKSSNVDKLAYDVFDPKFLQLLAGVTTTLFVYCAFMLFDYRSSIVYGNYNVSGWATLFELAMLTFFGLLYIPGLYNYINPEIYNVTEDGLIPLGWCVSIACCSVPYLVIYVTLINFFSGH